MKVTRIAVHQVDLPLHEGRYSWSGGKSVAVFDSTVVRIDTDGAMDVANIKISKFGGLTRARQARDLCSSMGVAMTVEDSWGGDIVTAAIAHLAHSTPTELLFTSTDFNSYGTVSIADGAPTGVNGRMWAGEAPGLGVAPKLDVLGKPVFEVS